MGAIFLSAGIPDQPERGPYLDASDPVAIRDAVRALAGAALLSERELVFGGHPAISPLVLQVARSLDRLSRVIIYQSRFYEDRLPPEAREFPNFVWTERERDREESLETLRRIMLGAHDFAAGVFIGGMDGVEREFELFRERHPGAPVIPVYTTGGAARLLWEQALPALPPRLQGRLRDSRHYSSLFREALAT